MPRDCAQNFMSAFYAGQQPDLTCIDQLCGLALSPDDLVAKHAVCVLYGSIVEGLCDDFSGRGVAVCNRVLLRIVSFLHGAGKPNRAPVLWASARRVGRRSCFGVMMRWSDRGRMALRRPPARIIVLSRVSIGADVMITSIVIQRLRTCISRRRKSFWSGLPIMGALLQFDQNVQSRLFPYERNCSLLERFEATCRLAQLVREECRGWSRARCCWWIRTAA